MTCSEPVIPEPSLAVAVTVTVPMALAVSNPLGPMVAATFPPGAMDQETVGLVAFDGATDALICTVPPTVTELAPDTEMPVTDTGGVDCADTGGILRVKMPKTIIEIEATDKYFLICSPLIKIMILKSATIEQ